MTKNLVTYRASAGSGKTYTLAVEFVSLCLMTDDPGYFKKILAITFTNKAAEELKERILLFMEQLITAGPEAALLLNVQKMTHAEPELIKKRASKVFSLMLFQYADLHVSTIDHFVLSILKSFSKELGLSFDFKVELDESRISELLVDELMKNIGRDTFITEALVSYSISELDDGKTWNPSKALIEASKHLFKEESSNALKELGAISNEDIEAGMKAIQDKVKNSRSRILELQAAGKNIMDDHGVDQNDFTDKSVSKAGIILKDLQSKNFVLTVAQVKKDASSLEAHKSSKNKGSAESVAPLIDGVYSELVSLSKELLLFDQIRKDRLTLLLANRLFRLLKQLEKDEDISLISGNNQRIAEVVRGNPSPFIYERLGERYRHFLIDEFQDTSLNQWHNFLPLLDNSLSNGFRNLLVGDAKQSIYRWRNSEVEQIIALPDIHKKDSDAELERIASVLTREHENKDLQDNYRSAEAIIQFNNEVFLSLSSLLPLNLSKAYSDVKQNVKKEGDPGYVQLNFLEKTLKVEDCLDMCLEQVRTCIVAGYNLSDIGILVRKNSDGRAIASFLESNGLRVNSSDSLTLRSNDQVHLLLHLLQFVYQKARPKSDLFVLQHLLHLLKKDKDYHIHALAYHKRGKEALLALFKEAVYPLNLNDFTQENIYQAAERLCRETWLDDQDPYVQELLDLIYAHSMYAESSLDAFLEFFDRKQNLSIKADSAADAVNLMTIHRSKGLQFPVVILPYWKIKASGKNVKKAWFHWDKTPFPFIPLKLSSALKGTVFEEAHNHEEELKILDEINLLYVACTRPEMRLYANLVASGALYENIRSHLKDRMKGESFSSGEIKAVESKEKAALGEPLKALKRADPHSILRTTSKKDSPYSKEREFGDHVHYILERCDEPDQVPEFIDSFTASLDLDVQVRLALEENVKAALTLEKNLGFKVAGLTCLKEQEILSPNGNLNRIDRLYLHPDGIKARILDYKTGIQREKDGDQMRKYIGLLKDMGYQDIQAFLIYTQELQIREVN